MGKSSKKMKVTRGASKINFRRRGMKIDRLKLCLIVLGSLIVMVGTTIIFLSCKEFERSGSNNIPMTTIENNK